MGLSFGSGFSSVMMFTLYGLFLCRVPLDSYGDLSVSPLDYEFSLGLTSFI